LEEVHAIPDTAAALTMTVLVALSFAQSPDDREDRIRSTETPHRRRRNPRTQLIRGMMPMMNTMMMLGWAGDMRTFSSAIFRA
jgi:hypothetical protein